MLNSLMITLSLFNGGTVYVNKHSVDTVTSVTCGNTVRNEGWWRDYHVVNTPCSLVYLKSGKDIYVTDSIDSILSKLK